MVSNKVNAYAEEVVRRTGKKDNDLMTKYMFSGDELLKAIIEDINDIEGNNHHMFAVFKEMEIPGFKQEFRARSYASELQNNSAEMQNEALQQKFKDSYEKLKDAIRATSNDKKLEKTAEEKAATITKKITSFVTNIVVFALNIVGRNIEAVGDLIHIVPIAAHVINRMPMLSKKATEKERNELVAAIGKRKISSGSEEVIYRKNIIQRVGQAIQDGARVASDKANPVTAAFAEADKVRLKHRLDEAGINYGVKSKKPAKSKRSEKQGLLGK